MTDTNIIDLLRAQATAEPSKDALSFDSILAHLNEVLILTHLRGVNIEDSSTEAVLCMSEIKSALAEYMFAVAAAAGDSAAQAELAKLRAETGRA